LFQLPDAFGLGHGCYALADDATGLVTGFLVVAQVTFLAWLGLGGAWLGLGLGTAGGQQDEAEEER
jgi:hypothetical protein